MKKVKPYLALFLILGIIVSCIVVYYMNQDWTVRFKTELNQFFGEGNWKCISEETKDSIIYEKHIISRDIPYSEDIPGKFKNWYIQFNNKYGNEEIWRITNHTLKINNDKYDIFSGKRYSNKQALILELMNIACEVAGEEAFNSIIKSELSSNEAECIDAVITYNGGNPEPEFYDTLFKKSWFTVKQVSTANFLNCDLYDFYLYIRAYDYKVEKLTDLEKQHLLDSFETIEKKLLQEYGINASFKIYFDSSHQVEYIDGVKQ